MQILLPRPSPLPHVLVLHQRQRLVVKEEAALLLDILVKKICYFLQDAFKFWIVTQLRGRNFYLLPWFWVWVLFQQHWLAGWLAAPVNVTLLQALVSSKQQSVRRYINTWRRREGPTGSYLRRHAGRWWLPPLVFLMSAFDCKRSRTRGQDLRRMLIFLFWAVYWFHQTVLQPPLTFLVAFLKWHQWNKKK